MNQTLKGEKRHILAKNDMLYLAYMWSSIEKLPKLSFSTELNDIL